MHKAAKALLTAGAGFSVAATLASLSRSPHWAVRSWDFPRMQIAALGMACGALHAKYVSKGRAADRLLHAAVLAAAAWQLSKIIRYTPLAPNQVHEATEEEKNDRDNRFSFLVSNVLQDNRKYELLLEQVDARDPDLVFAVEVDEPWLDALKPLEERYPHVVRQPLDNYYGMVLYSRLPLVDPEVRYLVQDDIPSIHTGIELPSGEVVNFHGIHPRPPEPLRDQISAPRDAELVLVGRYVGDRKQPRTIVAGDLNDVAWSDTSRLFVRLSGLLDPRVGRGMFNSFNANNPLWRYPLDHVFHSRDFKLVALERLPNIGSDHFPLFIDLVYVPEAPAEQKPEPKKDGDEKEADERLEVEAEAAATGADRPRGE